MPSDNPFKWRQFEPALILQCVRWYLRYALSYRDLEDMMRERGLCVDHTTIYRWVQRYAPEIDKRCRPFLRRTNDSYRIDETYVRVAGAWTYLGIVRLIRLDPKNLQSRTIRLQVDATRPGRRLGLVWKCRGD